VSAIGKQLGMRVRGRPGGWLTLASLSIRLRAINPMEPFGARGARC